MSLTPEQAVRAARERKLEGQAGGGLRQGLCLHAALLPGGDPAGDLQEQVSAAPVQVTDTKVEKVVCETADKCVATVRLEAKVLGSGGASTPPIVTYYDEVWVRENGQWWLFPTQ